MSEQVPKQTTDCKDKPNDQILVKVRGQDNTIIQFKIKKGTPFRKLMCAYCDKQGLDLDHMRFRFDGVAIGHNDTPRSIDIEDDDTIEAYMPQTGGLWLRH